MDNPGFIVEVNGQNGVKKSEKYNESLPSHTFEEAVSLVPVGRFHYLLLLVGGLCFMSVMVETMSVSIILPSMKCDLVSTIAQQGMLASSGFLGIVMSSHAMGFLADTWGRVKTLRLALGLAAITSVISAFSVNIWMLIVFRFLTGLFISGGQACVFSMAGEFHGNESRTRHVTLLSIFLPFALVFLPTVSIFILPIKIDIILLGMKFSSWRVLLLANCGLTVIALGGLFLIPEAPKYVLIQGHHDESLKILRTIFAKNTGRPASEYPVEQIKMEDAGASLSNISGVKDALKMVWDQTLPLFYKERCVQTINICLVLFSVYFISQGIFMWFPTLLNKMLVENGSNYTVCYILSQMGTDEAETDDSCTGDMDIFPFLVILITGGCFTLFYLIFSFTIDFIGKKNLILAWLVIACICDIFIHWSTNFYLIVVLLIFTMSIGNCGGLVSTIAMEYFPTNINAMGMCFIMMIGRLGSVFGSNVIGQLLFRYCDHMFWALLAACALLTLMVCYLPEKKHKKLKKVMHEISS